MTKEELEKEAEESFEQYKVTDEDYVVSPYSDDMGEKMLMFNYEYEAEETYLRLYTQGYLAGAEFGYNKANEWHYVKDELPKDNEYVLIYTDLNNCYVAKKVENHFMSKGWGFIPMSTVIAWKEIVLPKESE